MLDFLELPSCRPANMLGLLLLIWNEAGRKRLVPLFGTPLSPGE